MGSIYGGAAYDNGHEVSLFDANQEIVDRINGDGLVIERRDGAVDSYRIPAATDPAAIGSTADLVLFQVKGWATRLAADQSASIVAPGTVLLTLQNGLGNEEVLRARYPENPVLIGMSVHTVVTVGIAHYRHTGVRETSIGPTSSASRDNAELAAAAFRRKDFPVDVYGEKDIRTQQWAKFVLNCASLPTMALTRLSTPAAYELEVVFEHMDDLTRETCAIARAAGIDLDPDERVAFQRELFRTAGGRASMLGDVLAKRRTEIDTINGAAVMYAESHGVPAPLNRAMVALVKGLETAIELGEA
jgi:2-dehydropantoate 2-reductase